MIILGEHSYPLCLAFSFWHFSLQAQGYNTTAELRFGLVVHAYWILMKINMALILTSLGYHWCLYGGDVSYWFENFSVLRHNLVSFLILFNSDKQISTDLSIYIVPLKPTEVSQVFKESWDRHKVTVYSVIRCSLLPLLNFLFSMHFAHLWMMCSAIQVKKKAIAQLLLSWQNAFPSVYSQDQVLPP